MMVTRSSLLGKIIKPLILGCSFLFVYLPILVLMVFSFNCIDNPHHWQGFSWIWYYKVFTTSDILAAIKTSLVVAFASTFLSIGLGMALVIANKWWRPRWMLSVFMPSVIFPEIVMAVGILSLFHFLKIPIGYNSLIAGHTIVALGFVVPILRNKFAKLDPVLTEASLDLGATYWQTFYKVLLPLLMPSIIACAFLVFTLSLDDFFIAFFCAGPGQQTISTYAYAKVRSIADPSLNAISTLLLLFSCLMFLVLSMTKISKEIISDD